MSFETYTDEEFYSLFGWMRPLIDDLSNYTPSFEKWIVDGQEQTVKTVFDRHLGHMRFDHTFCKRIANLKTYFLQKNDEHIHFFSEKLYGAYMVKWLPSDSDMWWIDLCESDEEEVQEDVWKLPSIRKEFKVSSDAFNLLIFYLIHKVHHAMIDDKLKEQTKTNLMAIFNYKAVSSNMANHFKHGLADKSLSEATYNALSKRFDIKTSKGWGDMLDTRAERFMAKSSPHYKTYVDFTDDFAIVKMVNDARTRINNTVVEIAKVFYKLKEKGERLQKSSSTMMVDDGMVIKDLSRQRDKYIRYLSDAISDQRSFIKVELLDIVYSTIPNVDQEYFKHFLAYMSDNYTSQKKKYIKDWVSDLIIYTFRLLEENGINEQDLIRIAEKIRQNFMAGRTNDKLIISVKKGVDKMIVESVPKLNGVAVTAERVGIMIYVVLRAFTMKYYVSN